MIHYIIFKFAFLMPDIEYCSYVYFMPPFVFFSELSLSDLSHFYLLLYLCSKSFDISVSSLTNPCHSFAAVSHSDLFILFLQCPPHLCCRFILTVSLLALPLCLSSNVLALNRASCLWSGSFQPILHPATRVIISKYKSVHVTHLFKTLSGLLVFLDVKVQTL